MFLLVKHIFKMAVKKFAEYLQKEASNENNNLGHAEVYQFHEETNMYMQCHEYK